MFKLLTTLFIVVLLAYLSESSFKKKADYYINNVQTRPDVTMTLKEPLRRLDVWCFIAILIMGFFSGLRTDYNDTYMYKIGFRGADTVAEYLAENGFKFAGNPLFYISNSFVRQLTDDYHIFFLIIGLFSFWQYMRFFKKHAPYLSLSTYFFFTMGTFVFMMAAMKQAIAVAILTIAIDKLLEKKYVAFYIWVILAALFHFYAILFVILPLFTTKPWNYKTYLLLLGMLVCMVAFEGVITAFMESAEDVGKNVSEEEVFAVGTNIFRVLVYAVVPIITFIYRAKLKDLSSAENLFINMSIICFAVLCVGTQGGGNMFGRIVGYFELSVVISLPFVIKRCFPEKTAQLVTVAAVVCFFAYFLYEFGVAKDFSSNYYSITFSQFLQSLTA